MMHAFLRGKCTHTHTHQVLSEEHPGQQVCLLRKTTPHALSFEWAVRSLSAAAPEICPCLHNQIEEAIEYLASWMVSSGVCGRGYCRCLKSGCPSTDRTNRVRRCADVGFRSAGERKSGAKKKRTPEHSVRQTPSNHKVRLLCGGWVRVAALGCEILGHVLVRAGTGCRLFGLFPGMRTHAETPIRTMITALAAMCPPNNKEPCASIRIEGVFFARTHRP